MPRHDYTYPERMIKTDEGTALYGIWLRIRYSSCELFSKYPDFFEWAIANGYKLGARLRRFDDTVEYGPDNCSFLPSYEGEKPLTADEQKRAREWNRVVNRIRIAYGLEPFGALAKEVKNIG